MGAFAEKVFAVVKRIPAGKVASYGQIAKMIGSARSSRLVGYALRANPAPGTDPHSIPCHRVVFKDGSLAPGFAFGGEGEQRRMLQEEGVSFTPDGRVDMDACTWDPSHEESPVTSADDAHPTAPPQGFDWRREIGEY